MLLLSPFLLWLMATLVFPCKCSNPPEFVERPKDVTVRSGEAAAFYCRAHGKPSPHLSWRKNGRKISPRSSHYNIISQTQPAMSVLWISSTKAGKDDAKYECVAENGVAQAVVASATLSINKGFKDTTSKLKDQSMYEYVAENSLSLEVPNVSTLQVRVRRLLPHISMPLQTIYEVKPGSSLNITCVAGGLPMPYVKWRGLEDLTPENSLPTERATLFLKDIQETSSYTCVSSNMLGQIENALTLVVKVLFPTKFIHELNTMKKREAQPETVRSSPAPIIYYDIVYCSGLVYICLVWFFAAFNSPQHAASTSGIRRYTAARGRSRYNFSSRLRGIRRQPGIELANLSPTNQATVTMSSAAAVSNVTNMTPVTSVSNPTNLVDAPAPVTSVSNPVDEGTPDPARPPQPSSLLNMPITQFATGQCSDILRTLETPIRDFALGVLTPLGYGSHSVYLVATVIYFFILSRVILIDIDNPSKSKELKRLGLCITILSVFTNFLTILRGSLSPYSGVFYINAENTTSV